MEKEEVASRSLEREAGWVMVGREEGWVERG